MNIAAAFEGVGTSFTNIKNEITKEIEKEITTVQGDALLWSNDKEAFVAQHGEEKSNSKLTSLQNGDISTTSTDAVAGNQLHKLGTEVAKSFGGNAGYEDGQWTAPSFKVKTVNSDGSEVEEQSYESVAAAFEGVGTSFTNIHHEINKEIGKVVSDSLIKQDDTTKVIKIGGEKDGTEITVANSNGDARSISGVKAATLSEGSTEAVTGGQLYSLGSEVVKTLGGGASYENGTWVAPTFTVKNFNSEGSVSETTYDDVASAFTGVGNSFEKVKDSFKNIKNEITKEIEKEITTVQGDALLWDKSKGAFVATHGAEKSNSKLTSLQNGDISATSTDAVAGNQLYSLGSEVAKSFGGNAGYEDGQWTAPSFKVKTVNSDGSEVEEQSYESVAAAFEGVGTSFTNIHHKINKEIGKVVSDSLVKQDEETKVINIGAEKDGTSINIANKSGVDRTLSGVKAAENDNEAVNKSQLDKSLKKLSDTLQSEESAVVLYDKGTDGNTDYSSVTFGKGQDSAPVALHNVADGKITKDSHDAINGSQINQISQDVATYLGGGAAFTDGTFTGPTYKLSKISEDGAAEETSYDNVGNAVSGLDTNIKNVNERIKEVSQGVAQDSLLWDKDAQAFVAQHGAEKSNSKLTSLQNGDISTTSTDAVAGNQLYSLGSKVAKSFGGNAGYEDGQWTAPSFKVKTVNSDGSEVEEQSYESVAAAFEGVGTSFTNIHHEINKEIGKVVSDSLVKQDDTTKVIKIGGEKDGTEITVANSNGDARSISGVKAATLSEGSTEAVTGGQLYSLGSEVVKTLGGGASYENGSWVAPTFTVKNFNSEGSVSETTYDDVASAFTGVGNSFEKVKDSFKNIKNEITKEIEKEITTVQGDALLWSNDKEAFVATHGAEKSNSKLTSLQNGDISATSTDAVAGNQLHKLGTEVAKSFGGNAGYEDGQWTAPSFKVKTVNSDGSEVEEQSYESVAAAFEGVGTSFTNIHHEINKEIGKVVSDSLVKQDEATKIINIGAEKDGTSINIANKSGVDRTLSGVKAAENDNEAVNKSQLDKSLKKLSDTLQSEESAVVLYDKGTDGNTDYSSVTFGKGQDSAPVALHNVADGKITKDSHDAINGSQINQISQDVATYLGGGAAFTDGTFTGPTYKLSKISEDGAAEETSYDNVGNAVSGLDTNIKNVNERIKEVSQGVAQDSLLWDKDAQAFVAQHGEEKSNSKLTSLQNGDISTTSTDAVAGNQLYSLGSKVAKSFGGNAGYEDGQWTAPSFKVKTVNSDGSEVEEQSYESVAAAFEGVGTSFTNIHHEINKEIGKVVSDSLVKQDEETKVINIGAEKDGTSINIANKSGVDRTLSGVKAAENDNEAVNKSQLDKSLKKLSDTLQSEESAVVLYDKGTDGNTDYSSVTFGKGQDSAPVALHNVADGKITKDSHDAINGSQINQISQDVATYLGGGAAFTDGTFTGPTYKLSKISEDGAAEETSYDNVGNAVSGLDTNIKNVNERIKEVSQGVAQDSLLWDKDAQAFVAQHGAEKSNSKLTSLQNGDISTTSTDAVAGNQLYSLGSKVAKSFGGNAGYEDGQWTAPSFKVKTVNSDGSEVEEQSYESVAAAFEGVGTSFTNIHNEINKEIGKVVSDSLIKQDDTTKVINIGAEKDGTSINIANKSGVDRTLSGVKAAENDNEAVNKSQLDKSLKKLSDTLQSEESAVVLYDKGTDGNTDYSSVTFGKGQDSAPVALHNVADGKITKDSHDAINGSQINQISQDVATYLGGGAAFTDGTFTGPTYKLSKISEDGAAEETSYDNVGNAVSGLDTNIKNVNERIKEVSQGVAQDSLLWDKDAQAFVAQHGAEKSNSKLTSLQNGDISLTSTDAVAGNQLHKLGTEVAKSFGGNAGYEDGQWTAPSFKVKTVNSDGSEVEEQSYESVAAAFEGVGTSFTNIHNEINKEIGKVVSDSLIKQDDTTKVIKIGGEKDGTEITVANSNGDVRGISGVKAATLSEGSTEAVTGGQLYSLNKTLATYLGGGAGYEDGQWTAPSFKVKTINSDGSEVEEQSYESVAAAFEGVGTSFTNIHNEVKNEINKVVSDSLVKQDEATKVIKIGGEQEGTAITVANSNGDVRGISGVKAATLSEGSTEAVTGGQLYSLNKTLATYLGGGAGYEDGQWTAPSFKVKTVNSDGSEVEEQSYESVAAAFEVVGTSFTNIHSEVKNEINKVVSDSLVKQDEATKVIKIGGEKDGTEITVANSNGDVRGISGVKAATLSEGSTEAVTGGQLYSLNKTLATYLGGGAGYEDGQWTAPSFKVKTINSDGSEVEEQSYESVAAAFEGVGTSFTNIHNEVKNEINKVVSDSLVKQDEATKVIKIGGEQEGTAITVANSNGDVRGISGVKAATLSEGSTEAVTGGQLYSLNKTLATYLGGGAGYEDGQWTAPSFKVKTVNSDGSEVEEQSYESVAAAFEGVGTSFTNIHSEVKNEINKVVSDSLIKQDDTTKVIKIGGEKDGTEITVANSNGDVRGISGVKAATLSEGSTEAVTGGQLYSLNKTLATYLGGGAGYEDGQWTAPSFKVKTINSDGSEVEEQSYESVAAAFEGVGTSFTNIHNEVKNEINKVVSDSLVKQDEATKVIKIGGEQEGTAITVANSNGDVRGISGVKAATLSEGSTEAVTGGQLYSLNKTLATYLGGGAGYEDGQWTAPSFKVKTVNSDGSEVEEQSYESVAAAFEGVGTSFTNIHSEVKNEINKVVSDSLIKQDDTTKVIKIGGEKDGTEITVANSNGDVRGISGVKAATLSEGSTEAVTGGQLYSLNKTLATYLGGGAGYEDGQWTAPSFKVKTVNSDGSEVEEQSYESVAAAFEGVGTSFTNIHSEVKNEINKVVSDSLVKQDEATKVIKIGGEKDGTEITVANSNGDARSISGVKAATLSEGSTEAVTGGQLYSLNKTLATYLGGGAGYEDGQWTAPSFKVTHFKEDGSSEEKSYANVSDAFAGVSSSFTKLHNEISDNLEQNALLWSDEDKAFVALHGKGDERSKSKLKFLLDGDISEGSTEAVNGGQLYSLNKTLAAYFGGGAGYIGGQWIAPSFKVLQFNADGSLADKKSYHDVASAFDGVSESMTSINERIKEVSDNIDTNSLNWSEETGSYDALHKGEASKITNVLDGKIAEGSQEVVNGGQLWQTNEKLKDVENRVDTIDQQVQDITIAVTDGAVNYDKDGDGQKTNSITLKGGNESEPVLIENVKDGRIEEGSRQAVNGGQLHDYTDQQMKIVLDDAKKYTDEQVSSFVNNGVNEAKAYTDMKFEVLSYAIEDVRKEARQAAAIGLAVSNLSYDDTPGKLSVSFGTGVWHSQSAFAIGAGYMSEDGRIRSNLSATSAGGHWGVGAGFRITLN
ncbi:WXG100 family type VII secretion target [Candidatus Bartonella washoeensis]|nr:Vomp family autotransporter [Bartonella washoeensis]SPU28089.1 WXG100 family type VII secretion target [Bartonella washoeensis]